MPFDPFLLIVAAAIALFIFMQIRTGKKRRAEAESLQEQMVPGTKIMTNYGLFATILSIDEDTNEALVETTPGTVLRIHRQTILKTVEDQPVMGDPIEDVDTVEPLGEPEFGERAIDSDDPRDAKGNQ